MLHHLRPAIVSLVLFTALLGLGYPLAITGLAQAVVPGQANGSMIRNENDVIVGSALIGQNFSRGEYFHPRPSAAGAGYDAAASSGSNMGPLNADLAARIATSADALRAETPGAVIPANAVTASGSGLDPDISPANARLQSARVAAARGVATAEIERIAAAQTKGRLLGFIGQPRINVLETNLALDHQFPVRPAATQSTNAQ